MSASTDHARTVVLGADVGGTTTKLALAAFDHAGSEILARRDQFVQESVGLKMSWRKECSAPVKRLASSSE